LNPLEEHIISLLKEDPEKAMSLMYDHYYDYLMQVVYRILQDDGLTQDAVQSVFIGIWQKKEKLNINISLKQYLRRSAINKSLNQIRSLKVMHDDHEAIEDFSLKDVHDHTLEIEAEELSDHIGEAIASLPERCRLVFSLSRYEEMSYKEIAENLQISVKTVENQITKALKLMRDKIDIKK
jgi:RNA polymerase sigma-70 factor (ECF subfamily)